MSGEQIAGSILVGSAVVVVVAPLLAGISAIGDILAGMLILAAGLAVVLYGIPFGAVAWGLVP